MILLEAASIDDLYIELTRSAVERAPLMEASRLGPAIDLGLVALKIPANQIPFISAQSRSINPYLAVIEACWILAGSDAVAPLAFAVKRYSSFSDDGIRLNGAYGYRLRHQFSIDQIKSTAAMLRRDPTSRRAFLSIGHASDLVSDSRDIPCNIGAMFRVRDGNLDMTVFNRSNDIYLGVPYDLFSFSVLHEYISQKSGFPKGVYTHISNSMHLYASDLMRAKQMLSPEKLAAKKPSFCFSGLVQDIVQSYEAIAELDFRSVESQSLQKFLLNFQQLRSTGDTTAFIKNLSHADFGNIALNWARSSGMTQ